MVNEYKGEIETLEKVVPGEFYQRLTDEPGEHKIPRFFTPEVNNLSHNKTRTIVVYTNQNFQKKTLTVPGDVEVKRLTGRLSRDFKKKFTTAKFAEILAHRTVQTVGTDPEFFVEIDGKCLPAFNFLRGKDKPHKTPTDLHSNNRGSQSVYYDGYQGEFTTQAGTCLEFMLDSFQLGLKTLYDLAKAYNPKAVISSKSVIEVSLEDLAKEPDEHVQFGCMPSFNVYGLKGIGVNGRDAIYRPAGGHMHFGIPNLKEDQIPNIIKALDSIVGVASVSCFEGFETVERRRLYGQAGEYRTPPHGLEYRVLPNTVFIAPAIANLFFDLARKAVTLGNMNLNSHWKATEEETLEVIMGLNYTLAREILKRNEDLLIAMLMQCYRQADVAQGGYKTLYEGINKVLKNPHDLEGNWCLKSGWKLQTQGHNHPFRFAGKEILKGNKI